MAKMLGSSQTVGAALGGRPDGASLKSWRKSQSIFHFPFDIFHLSLPEQEARAVLSLALVACAMTRQPGDYFLPDDK